SLGTLFVSRSLARRCNHRSAHWHDRAARRIGSSGRARENFLLNIFNEVLNLTLHLFHPLTHLQDDGDPANVHAEVAGKIKDKLEALQVFVGVEARVAFGAGGLEQALALIKPKGLSMH